MMVTARDFDRLCVASGRNWTNQGWIWETQEGRFENYADGKYLYEPPRKNWTHGYHFTSDWATVMLARQFLLDNGHEFEIMYDLCYPNDEGGWAIFTDYHTED